MSEPATPSGASPTLTTPTLTTTPGSQGPVVVRAAGLQRTYSRGALRVAALRDATFTLHAGTFGVVTGRSGSGKSTLLHLLAGLDEADAGELEVAGLNLRHMAERERVRLRRQHVRILFQAHNLVEHLTLLDNAALALRYAGVGARERLAAARTALEAVGLGHRLDFYPAQISGGEQQRAALARALAGWKLIATNGSQQAPLGLILADEPTGELDSETGHDILDLLRKLAHDHGAAVLVATHDAAAVAVADRHWVMHDGCLTEQAVDR